MTSRGLSAVAILLALGGCLAVQGQSAEPKTLPRGIFKALAVDEKAYCDQFLGDFKKGCRQDFRLALVWRELELSPTQIAILIELQNVMGQCGSAGCTLYLFVLQSDGKVTQVLGPQGDIGELGRITVLKTLTEGHYDIEKKWSDGKTSTIYKWHGLRYSAMKSPD